MAVPFFGDHILFFGSGDSAYAISLNRKHLRHLYSLPPLPNLPNLASETDEIRGVCFLPQDNKVVYASKNSTLIIVDLNNEGLPARSSSHIAGQKTYAVQSFSTKEASYLLLGGKGTLRISGLGKGRLPTDRSQTPLRNKLRSLTVQGQTIYGVNGYHGKCYAWNRDVSLMKILDINEKIEHPLAVACLGGNNAEQ